MRTSDWSRRRASTCRSHGCKHSLAQMAEVAWSVRRESLRTIDQLSDTLDFSDYAGRIVHPLVRCIDTSPDLRPAAMDCLAAIVLQLGKKFKIFIPMLDRVVRRHRISHQRYELLRERVLKDVEVVGPDVVPEVMAMWSAHGLLHRGVQ